MAKNEILKEIERSPFQKIKVAVTDVDGVLRGKYLLKDKFLSAAQNGFGFCNVVFGWDSADVCYDNGKFTGWQTGYPDALAEIDLQTYRKVPWDAGVPFFLGQFITTDGKPLPVCPRQLLRAQIKRAEARGLSEVRHGPEWFNFRRLPRRSPPRVPIVPSL